MLTVALVIASAALHAAWNALLKRTGQSRATTVAVVLSMLVVATLAMLVAPRPWFPTRSGFAWTLASGVLEAGYFVALANAIERAPVSVTYPVSRGGALLVVWPISILWLTERPTWGAALGAAIVLAGLMLAGFRRPHAGERTGVRWAVLSAVFIGCYNLMYKQALVVGVQPMALFAVSMMVALPLNLLWLGRGNESLLRALREVPLRIAVAGVLSCASFWLYLYALRDGGTGEILTLRNTSVVFAQLFAAWSGETVGRRQVAGALVITAGALALGWARA